MLQFHETQAFPAPATATRVPARALLRGDEIRTYGRVADIRKGAGGVWVTLEDGRTLSLLRHDRVALAN